MENHATVMIPSPSGSRLEDAALKTMMHFFADELLPYLGIEGEVVSVAPTELVYLELKNLFQDFNLVMSDGTWKHFEFQSTYEGIKDLKRFRSYEAVASYKYNVSITTYVLYSGNIKNPVTEYSEGVNTYRVIPIIMQDKNADDFLEELQKKKLLGESISRSDLIMLTLCPLMSGQSSIKSRIAAAYTYTKDAAENVAPEDIRKIEAVIYAMAEKFLENVELEDIKEMMCMTRLGQMLINEGMEKGRKETLTQLSTIRKAIAQYPTWDNVQLAVYCNCTAEELIKAREVLGI